MRPRPPAEPLSVAMRTGSREAHERAEATPFLRTLVDGSAGPGDYRRYLLALQHVYRELEHRLRATRTHPAVAAVWDPGLERSSALSADLAWWSGDAAGPAPVATPALTAYADRLAVVAAGRPELLVAHHYTRYLGDLAGGQAIAHALRRSFGIGDDGLSFYAFSSVPSPPRYRQGYRARLDALPLTPDQRHDVVAEVRTAFALNTAVLLELGDPALSPVDAPAGSR